MLAQNDTGTQTDANGGIELPTVEVTANQQGTAGAGGEGAGGTGCGSYGGAPCSGFGGAGLAQDPFNTSYVLPDAQHRHQDRYAGHGHALQCSVGHPAGAAGSAGITLRPGVAECQRRDSLGRMLYRT